MSGKNSGNKGSVRSTNVTIAKVRQDAESARQGAEGARESVEGARLIATGIGNRATAMQNVNLANQIPGAIPTPSGCSLSRDCAEGWACIDGTCMDMSGPGSDRITTPGNCDLPGDGLEANPCGESGGCAKPTCGENVGEGGIDCCGGTIFRGFVATKGEINPITGDRSIVETWTEQCEPLETACDQYADSWYKSTGDLLVGYEVEQICSSCSECGFRSVCVPLSDISAPCYCNPEKCKDREGPCFDCDFESGDCLETCKGCVAECNQYFTCPCDPAQGRYEARGSFNPCTSTSGGCWAPTAEKIRSFCAETFPCQDENQCKGDCETLKSTSGYPGCPAGKTCQQNGFIRNAETGVTTYFVTACYVKPDCGCAAPPDSPLYLACGECEVCENGSCAPDPACGDRFESDRGRNYEVFALIQQKSLWQCITCWDGQPYAEPGTHCGTPSSPGTATSFSGGCCDPADPDCVTYGYPCTSFFEGKPYSDSSFIYSDGAFAIAGEGSSVVSNPCRDCLPGQSGESEITLTQVGSYSYERRVNLFDDTGATVKRLMVQYTLPISTQAGVSRFSCMINPNDTTNSWSLAGVKPASFTTKAPLSFPVSTWPPTGEGSGYVGEVNLDT